MVILVRNGPQDLSRCLVLKKVLAEHCELHVPNLMSSLALRPFIFPVFGGKILVPSFLSVPAQLCKGKGPSGLLSNCVRKNGTCT